MDGVHVVLPVGVGTTPFFSFPSDPIADVKVFVENWKDERGSLPVAANVNGCRWAKERDHSRNDTFKPSDIFIGFLSSENVTVVVLGQVVWRIENQQVGEVTGKKTAGLMEVLIDDAVSD